MTRPIACDKHQAHLFPDGQQSGHSHVRHVAHSLYNILRVELQLRIQQCRGSRPLHQGHVHRQQLALLLGQQARHRRRYRATAIGVRGAGP